MKFPSIHLYHGAEIPEEHSGGEQASAIEKPDARIYLYDDDRGCLARAALWWTETPAEGLGLIGGFFAMKGDAALRLLEASMEELRLHGCTRAVGPMNGNTWRSYRLVDESDGREPFYLEPRNPPQYPAYWRAAGFTELARYSSSAIQLDNVEVVSERLKSRLLRSGLTLRKLDTQRYEDELRLIHRLSLKGFAHNFLYTPLDEKSFIQSYQKSKRHWDPDLVLIAERKGNPCGFVFGFPDWEAATRGEDPALIVKTLAVDPDAQCAGLGSLLIDELHRIARQKGYKQAIHALQHENNISLKITARHHGSPFRRYVLFCHPL